MAEKDIMQLFNHCNTSSRRISPVNPLRQLWDTFCAHKAPEMQEEETKRVFLFLLEYWKVWQQRIPQITVTSQAFGVAVNLEGFVDVCEKCTCGAMDSVERRL